MKPPAIKEIARQAQTNAQAILGHWLPGGKLQGHEYLVRNPRRADDSEGSFSISMQTGKWSDFATGDKGNDLVSLVAYLTDCTQSKAAEEVARFLNIPIEQADGQNRSRSALKDAGNATSSPQSKKSKDAHSDKGFIDDGWHCVMPVPEDAPSPPEAHRRQGKPDCRYAYLNIDGRLNYYHDRWNAKADNGRKQFAPLTLWQNGNQFKWQFKAPPAPRPLYGLPSLVQYPDAWVWIVEGEKAAAALSRLLPDHPILTWQGGSMAVDKSDFQPLKGRRVRIWPDYDAAGKKATRDLIQLLQQIGAHEIEVLNLDRVSGYMPAFHDTGRESVPRIDRTGTANLQAGDDAHDLLTRDRWTAGHFQLLLTLGVPDLFLSASLDQRGDPAPQSDSGSKAAGPGGSVSAGNFEVSKEGVFHLQQDKEGTFHRRKICNQLEVLAQSRDPNGGQWGKLVRFSDPDGRLKNIVIPMRAFNGDGMEATGRLLDDGLAVIPKARQLVLQYLQEQCPDKRASVTDKTGWHGTGDTMVYVLPNRFIGDAAASDEWLFANHRQENHFTQQGTLDEWKQHVARLCHGNSRLIFSICTAFASPLLHILGLEGGGFHWRGDSSSGKSTVLQVAASVCGGRQYVQRWRSTDNSMEGIAQSHSDALLVLDEIKELEPRVAGETAYMLSHGSGKSRSNSDGTLRSKAKWRLLYLSSGELSLSEHMASIGKETHAGMELRLCDLPADAGKGSGVFDDIHGYANGAEFSKALDDAARQFYGTAFIAFIEQILSHRQAIIDQWNEARAAFERSVLDQSVSGQARRVAREFALAGFAGELASEWQITGWDKSEAMTASIRCFRDWLAEFGTGNREHSKILSKVKLFIEQHGDARFADVDRLNDSHAPRTPNMVGYREDLEDGRHYYVFNESFKKVLFASVNYRVAARLLSEKGFMNPPEGRNLPTKVTLKDGTRPRMFHIYPSLLGSDDE
ncbi:DUF927 domain-containing protein [Nitrosomonas sp. HPC101]|uniref:DUF927 domain-containing protein n=1 Tax=Nitrosomonas sp. HPC101 TaxID=1658667 RepID=UPI00136C0E1D|nr:DUF927 domain-containing protein [Nitrosomonas sp. HPC101]MXS84484.1 DUF927 domain-containing protein [Nitrosomonas sp. HPC101]